MQKAPCSELLELKGGRGVFTDTAGAIRAGLPVDRPAPPRQAHYIQLALFALSKGAPPEADQLKLTLFGEVALPLN
jgi:hypothetical protein